jgi:hypothetical protein
VSSWRPLGHAPIQMQSNAGRLKGQEFSAGQTRRVLGWLVYKEFKIVIGVVLGIYSQRPYEIVLIEIPSPSSRRFVMGHVDLHTGVGLGLSQWGPAA